MKSSDAGAVITSVRTGVQSDKSAQAQLSLLVLVWAATLLVSNLPNIIVREFQILPTFPLLWAKLGLLMVCLAITVFWKTTKPLRPYFLIFIALLTVESFFYEIGSTPVWQSWFGGADAPFATTMLGSQLLRLGVALIMIAVLWALYRRRSAFFLRMGEPNAVASPVRWLGIERPLGWKRFGLILTICITGGTLLFLILSSQPSFGSLVPQVVPLIPFILLISGMNAFSEEVSYRAALLSPLFPVIGKSQSLLLTASLFGLWHFDGVPYGVIGVLMAGGLGWILSKSMLETKGMFWAWFIHFWQDVAIFTFIAASAIAPGG